MSFNKDSRRCPKCDSDWDGGSIVDTFKEKRDKGGQFYKGMSDAEIEKMVKESYRPPYRWGREIGIELPYSHPNHYDGISYIKCPDCNTLFDRFSGEETKL
jgi:hypothetical protein